MPKNLYPRQSLPLSKLYDRSTLSTVGQSEYNLGLPDPPTDCLAPYARPFSVALGPSYGTQVVPNPIGQPGYNLISSGILHRTIQHHTRPSCHPLQIVWVCLHRKKCCIKHTIFLSTATTLLSPTYDTSKQQYATIHTKARMFFLPLGSERGSPHTTQ